MKQEEIFSQVVSIHWETGDRSPEALIYKLEYLQVDQTAPLPLRKQVRRDTIKNALTEFRHCLDILLHKARLGEDRGAIDIESHAKKLSLLTLPEQGLLKQIAQGFHPRLDVMLDPAAEIPWEILSESFFICPSCQRSINALENTPEQHFYCQHDGTRLEYKKKYLAVDYFLTHLVRGQGRVSHHPNKFLFIIDPKEDLMSTGVKANISTNHHQLLIQCVKKLGYKVILKSNKWATCNHFLAAISEPDLAGIYYFGHGEINSQTGEGGLVLSDGMVYAEQIESVSPTARFVFLNACHGAASGNDFSFNQQSLSIAEAFAAGGRGKVVIAPLWPIINAHAAEIALAFFQYVSPDKSLAEVWHFCRQQSLLRYQKGMPDLSWMAYRYLGDPESTLPKPIVANDIDKTAKNVDKFVSRLFDKNQRLNKEMFGFALDQVLLRAAKRMVFDQRMVLTIADFVAGLLRRGDLTRYLLSNLQIDSDALYHIVETSKFKSDVVSDEHTLQLPPTEEISLTEVLEHLLIRKKQQFSIPLVNILLAAEKRSVKNQQDQDMLLISEQAIINELIKHKSWRELITIGLPNQKRVSDSLQAWKVEGLVDSNGYLYLDALDDKAKKVIQHAHELAQSRGTYPFSHRLLMIALLQDEKGTAANACQQNHANPKLLKEMLMTLLPGEDPRTFGLSPEVGGSLLEAVLSDAKQLTGENQLLKEETLFLAFCHCAQENFKQMLKLLSGQYDLDKLAFFVASRSEHNGPCASEKNFPEIACFQYCQGLNDMPKMFNNKVLTILADAVKIAKRNHVHVLMSAHLFAAMLSASPSTLNDYLSSKATDKQTLKEHVIRLVSTEKNANEKISTITISPHVVEILNRAKISAQSLHKKVDEKDLFVAFFIDGGGIVGKLFDQMGIHDVLSWDNR